MFSIKLKLIDPPDLEKYFKEFGKLKRICYQRQLDGMSLSATQWFIKNNIKTFLDGVFIENAALKAKSNLDAQKSLKIPKMIFGGKRNFEKLKKGKISKDTWNKYRNSEIYSIGRKGKTFGNNKFKINAQDQEIHFYPDRKTRFILKFKAKSKIMDRLLEIESMAKNNEMAITYKLTREHIILCIDETKLAKNTYIPISSRVMGIDLNPEYIAISISDFDNQQNEVFSQIFDIRKCVKSESGKKKYEQFQISHRILKLCQHFRVEKVMVEKLENFNKKDYKRGKQFNKLINQWTRKSFINNLNKLCNLHRICFIEVLPEYSSFIGCLMHPNKIDSIAASLEIARRGQLFYKVFIENSLPRDTKIVFPEWNNSLMNRWKEELGEKSFTSWKYAYNWFKKNPKLCYRVLFTDENREVFRFKSKKSKVFLCSN